MEKITVYDKVSWHYPEGKDCPNLNTAKGHISAIMSWLKKNNLLSEEGKEIFNLGIGAHFSITSAMLTGKGNDVMELYYKKWLNSIDYSDDPKKVDLTILNNGLKEIK